MSVTSKKVGGGSSSAYRDYLREQAEILSEYYGLQIEGLAFARVEGKAADHLGVRGGITEAQYAEIHAGKWEGVQQTQMSYQTVWERTPDGKLVRDAQGKTVPTYDADGKKKTTPYRTSWIDMTAAAPKSLSEYMIATTPEVRQQILKIWDDACVAGINHLEEHAYLVRKTINGTYVEGTMQQGSATDRVRGAHILALPVTQMAARHTEETIARGSPPDPHLHTHIPIATMAYLPDPTHPTGMRPLAVDQYGIKRSEETINAVIMGECARELENIGIELEYTKSRRGAINWEVKSIPKEASRLHSSNTRRLEALQREFEHQYGKAATRQDMERAMNTSRISKRKDGIDKEADSKGAWDLWNADLEANGIVVEPQTPGRPIERESFDRRRQQLYDRLMAADGLTKENAAFTADSILKSMEMASVGLGFTQDEIKGLESSIRDELHCVRPTNDERYTYYTTKVELAKESRIDRGLDNLAGRVVIPPPTPVLDAVLDGQKNKLDERQMEAFFAGTTRSVTFIEGVAGAGKSTTVSGIVEALREAGLTDQVVTISTSSKVAQDTGIKIGADIYGSVDSIESRLKSGTFVPTPDSTYVVEEAAMVDNDHIDRMFMAARGQGRFIFVGDPAQLSSIGAGGWYRDAVEKHGAVMLTESHRFDGPTAEQDVADYTNLRTGDLNKVREAVNNLDERGRVHVFNDVDDRTEGLFNKYKELRDNNPLLSVDDVRILVESTNADVDSYNNQIQFDQKQRGELTGKSVRVHDEEQRRQWSLHENESIVFLRSHFDPTTKTGIKNGTSGRIVSIDEETRIAQVQLAEGRVESVPLPEFDESQVMGPSGAQHIAKFQGGEVEYALFAPGTKGTANANSAYSEITRAKKESHFFLDYETHGPDPKETVSEAWSEQSEKKSARRMIREQKESEGIGLKTPEEKTVKRDPVPTPTATLEREEEPQQQPEPQPQPRRESLRERFSETIRERSGNRFTRLSEDREAGKSPVSNDLSQIRRERAENERDNDRGL